MNINSRKKTRSMFYSLTPQTQLPFKASVVFLTILIKHRCQNNRLSTRLLNNCWTRSVSLSLSFHLLLPNSRWQTLKVTSVPGGALRGSWLHHAERIVPRYYSFPAWGVFLLWELINWANLIRKSRRAAAETAHTVRAVIQCYSSIYLKSLTLQTVFRVLKLAR